MSLVPQVEKSFLGTLGSSSTEDVFDIPPVGVLYTLDSKRKLTVQAENILITNGLAFNDATKKFYHIDSKTKIVYRFDFDLEKGSVSKYSKNSQKVVFNIVELQRTKRHILHSKNIIYLDFQTE